MRPSVKAVLGKFPAVKILGEEDGRCLIQGEMFEKGVEMWLRGQGEMVKEVCVKKV